MFFQRAQKYYQQPWLHQHSSVVLISLHIQVDQECPNTVWCQVSSDQGKDRGGVSTQCQTGKAQLSSTWLPPARTPSSSVITAEGLVAAGQGTSRPVWGCINSILVFPNCCLYQVLSLRLTSPPRPADRRFLSQTRIVRLVLCYQEPPTSFVTVSLLCSPRWDVSSSSCAEGQHHLIRNKWNAPIFMSSGSLTLQRTDFHLVSYNSPLTMVGPLVVLWLESDWFTS